MYHVNSLDSSGTSSESIQEKDSFARVQVSLIGTSSYWWLRVLYSWQRARLMFVDDTFF